MWIVRDKNGSLRLYTERPIQKETIEGYENFDWCTDMDKMVGYLPIDLFPDLRWKDEPIEVEVVSINELLFQQNELKDAYHELIEFQTKKISNLTRVLRGVALEDVADIINGIEDSIYRKYKMVGNPNCSQNCRRVTIPYSSIQLGDNSLQEFIVDDKVVTTIYIRRNDFNTADIIVSDLGGEYNNESN